MAGGAQARFGLQRAGRAWHWANRGGQPDEIEALTLERFARPLQPRPDIALGRTLKRQLDQARVTAVDVAQQMDGIGQIAAGMASGCFEQGIEIGMAGAAFTRDSAKLRKRCTDRLLART